MTNQLIDPRRVVGGDRFVRGNTRDKAEAERILGEPVKLANLEWKESEGWACPFVEQVWMPVSASHDAGVCQRISPLGLPLGAYLSELAWATKW